MGRPRLTDEERKSRDAAAKRAYSAAHPDYHRRYYEAHREEMKERSRQWYRANQERNSTYNHRRRARMRQGTPEDFFDREIFERDGWVCQLCLDPIDEKLSWPDPQSASLDHIVALSRGGQHTRANTQASHLRCNMRKR